MGGFSISSILYFLASFCIVMFFVINGFLLFQKEEITCEYLEDKIKKYIKIILMWSALMLMLENNYGQTSLYTIFLNNLKANGNMPVFWFLGTLIIIYIIFVPILHKLRKKSIFLVITILMFVYMYLNNYIKFIELPQFLRIYVFLPYFCIGIIFASLKKQLLKINKRVIYIISISYTIIYISYVVYKNYNIYFSLPENNYSSPDFTIWIITLFITFLNINVNNEKIKKIILFFENNSIGIYAIHLPVLTAITKYHPITSDFRVGVMIIFLFILCATISNILKHIPILRHLVS